MTYKHIVYRPAHTIPAARPVKELTTDRCFSSVKQASHHFNLDAATIVKYANNRSKRPQHPYKFEWIHDVSQER